MISLIQYISSKLFYSNTEDCSDNIDENNKKEKKLQNFLNEIVDIRQDAVKKEEPQTNHIEDEEGCFYKTGIVSHITNDYVLIENKYMCELKNVEPTDLQKGDKVHYLAYKVNKNEELKVRKIVYKFDAVWETDNYHVFNPENFKNDEEKNSTQIVKENDEIIPSSDQIIEKREISKRVIVGKVKKRKGREVFLEEDNVCINLDRVSSEFVPVIGDWVKLECLVEVDENVSNLKGELLEVQSMLPLRYLSKMGKVTQYDEATESGVIERNIVFIKGVCASGYIPCIGDKVFTQSIESDQGVQQHWRSLSVVPMEDVTTKFETSIVKFRPQLPTEELEEIIKDKENLKITDQINVILDAKTEKEIDITIENNGNIQQTIVKCSFLSKLSESQLSLIYPVNNESQYLKPSDQIIYKFKCKAKFVGVSEELIIFKFRKFKIGRIFRITVNSLNLTNNTSIDNTTDNKTSRNTYKPMVVPQNEDEGTYIKGVRPYSPAKFIAVRPVTWKIPAVLWSSINTIISENKTHAEAEFLLSERIPCLQQNLSIQNYKQRFDYLLYLEEIAQILNMQRFTMNNATMRSSGEYLVLSIPGLAEKRPSLICGDKAIVSFEGSGDEDKRNYEGYIHKIKSIDIYLKFDPRFHEIYLKHDCSVSFRGSTTVIQRCHTAINTVVTRLGEDFLFPKKVIQKEPQYDFVEDGETLPNINDMDTNEMKLKLLEKVIKKRKIRWFNKNLNKYQQEAVKNILKGLARPLPYVIFGPPGTGKTITVCESILQILFTVTESRILIATPSNTSANLITERLLDSKVLQPGDLIRLVAHHYMSNENISERLIPYCVTADISSEGSRSGVNLSDSRGCKTNVTLSVLSRHRVIVGTCSALGILYNMGCRAGHFTHIFVDEAGQSSEPEIMIPLSLASPTLTQVILAGDPKQLGPINQSRYAGYFGLNDSFLVRLLQQFPYQRDLEGFISGYDPRLITKLLMNYRSLPDLLELPNKLFYEAELIPMVDSDTSKEAALLESLSDMLPKRLGGAPPVIFHGVQGENLQDPDSPSWYNQEEATQVYIYLLDLYNHGLTPDDIGIITPYSKQVYKIKCLLAELEVDIPKVGSVEEFQGQERKVIILSTVRTAEDKVKEDVRHALGFVAARERLNVAITRARTLLIIIGNSKLLQQDVYWRSVLEHCSSRNSWIGR